MTKNAPDDTAELQATAENPPTPESHPRTTAPDDPMRLKRRDLNDSRLGQNGNKHRTDGSGFLPDDSDTDNDGRTGILSTYTEVHSLVLGVTAGAHWGLSGDMQLINDVIGLGILGDRARHANGFSKKYLEQAKEELPYFVAGVLIGYAGARSDIFAGTGIGV